MSDTLPEFLARAAALRKPGARSGTAFLTALAD